MIKLPTMVGAMFAFLNTAQAQFLPPTNPDVSLDDPVPTRVLDCGGGTITNISDRFGGPIGLDDFAAGSAVDLNNGARGVSYGAVRAIQKSRIGDPVLVCLVYIPYPCPPGDERGRVYTMTNLRTLGSWSLPDAQHGCGGA